MYPKQRAAMYEPKRISVIEAGTKCGKTISALEWLLAKALRGDDGESFWWIAPVFGQAEIGYRRMKKNLKPLGGLCSYNQTTMTIILPNKTRILFKSGERSDDLYGEDVYAAVMDEASRMREESWHALRSTLTATRGPVRIIGNVKGKKNWFYQLARLAEKGSPDMGYHKMTCWDAVDAGVLDRAEIEASMRDFERLGRLGAWKQLYMAEVGDDGDNPFGLAAIEACTLDMQGNPIGYSDNRPIVAGVDLAGRGALNINPAAETVDRDYTAVMMLDRHGHATLLRQFRKDQITTQQELALIVKKTPALIDSTGAGDETVLRLQRRGDMRVEGFRYTENSRQDLLEGLAAAIGAGAVKFPDEPGEEGAPGLVEQLEAFEYDYSSSGVMRFRAPKGFHDDAVMALALAVKKLPWRRSLNEAPLGMEKQSQWLDPDSASDAWNSYLRTKQSPVLSPPAEKPKPSVPMPMFVASGTSRWSGAG
jgi:hypothetical protein